MMTENFVKYIKDMNNIYRVNDDRNNKNKCGKLHEYRGQSFCSSSCELPY